MIAKVSKKNKKLELSKIDELEDKILRIQAEFDNYRKRTEIDKIDFVKYANANLLSNFLPVLDNFKRAAMHSPKSNDGIINNWIVGVKAIERQLEEVIKQYGVNEIEANPGQTFDHNLHEAISHEESKLPVDSIVGVIENGYILNNKVIRPAKVRVSAGIPQELPSQPE